MRLNIWILSAVMLVLCGSAYSEAKQDNSAEVIKKAMKDELRRNINNLTLEDLQRPFYISYLISDAKALTVNATLGAIIRSEYKPYREHEVTVKVGDYELSDDNYMDLNTMVNAVYTDSHLPLNDDYLGIRRALWLETDALYKSAAEAYESKISAMKQQNLSDDQKDLPDFSKADDIVLDIKPRQFKMDKQHWEEAAKEISAVFKDYKDIYSSEVSIFVYNAQVYFQNTEESSTSYPLTLAAVVITAQTQAEDGEPLADHILHFALTPEDLPDKQQLILQTKDMAKHLSALRQAPVFDDNYSGPVLFEEQAVGEFFSQRLFSGTSGLLAARKPIYSDPQMLMIMNQFGGKSLEDKIGKKILSNDISIIAKPKLEEYDGVKLIGTFSVDAEAVIPPDELVLVEEGILKNLLNGRTPSAKVRESNGHMRTALSGGGVSSDVGPGVIVVDSKESAEYNSMKSQLIEKAKEEDLEYAFIVRKLRNPNAGIKEELSQASIMSMAQGMTKEGALSKPISIYKINLEDGSETLMRSIDLGGLSVSKLKDILSVSQEKMVYNNLMPMNAGGFGGIFSFAMSFVGGGGWSMNGIPVSFVIPKGILFEEIEVTKDKRPITMKPPAVENPIGVK